MAIIEMTRAEYEAKYGSPPPAPEADDSNVIEMTRAEYEAKYGQPPDVAQSPISIPAETGKGLVRGGGQGITASGFGMEALGSGVASWLNRRASETEADMKDAGQLGPNDSLARFNPSPLEGIGEQTRRMYQQPLEQAFPEDPRLADVTLKPTEILTQDQPARAIAAKLGSSLGEAIPSVGAAMGGALVGGAVGGPPGAIAGGGIVGGLMEGAGQYEEAIARGATPDEASRQAAAMGIMASGLNALPFAAALNKFLPGNKVGLGLRIIAGSLAEGGTETLEGAASQIAALQRIPEGTDEWVSFTKDLGTAIKQESEVFLPSMLLGGGMVAPQAVDATRAKAVSDAPMSDFYGFDPATSATQATPESIATSREAAIPRPVQTVPADGGSGQAIPINDAPIPPTPAAWDFEQPIPSGLTDEQLDEWMSGYLASQEPSVAPEAITTPQEPKVATTVTQDVPVAPVKAQQTPAVEPSQSATPSKPRAIADLPADQQSALRTLRDQNPQGGVTTAQVKAIVGGTRESVKALRDEVNSVAVYDPRGIAVARADEATQPSLRQMPTTPPVDEYSSITPQPARGWFTDPAGKPTLPQQGADPRGLTRQGGAQPGLTQMRRPYTMKGVPDEVQMQGQGRQEEVGQTGGNAAIDTATASVYSEGMKPARQMQDQMESPTPGANAPSGKILYDDDYDGPRYTYGMTYRPVGMATLPKGWIVQSNRNSDGFAHGTIDFPRELTPDEIRSYELTPVPKQASRGSGGPVASQPRSDGATGLVRDAANESAQVEARTSSSESVSPDGVSLKPVERMTKSELAEELAGPEKSNYTQEQERKKLIRNFISNSKEMLTDYVSQARARNERQNTIYSKARDVYDNIAPRVDAAGSKWQSELRAIAEEYGTKVGPQSTKGEMTAILSQNIAERLVSEQASSPRTHTAPAEASQPLDAPNAAPEAQSSPQTAPAASLGAQGVAKQPWEMTREEYRAKGAKTHPDGRDAEMASQNAFDRLKAARNALIAAAKPKGEGQRALDNAFKSTRPGVGALKQAYRDARADYDSKVLEADRFADHKYYVESALREGQPVPPAVLADYPDLAAKYGQAQQAAPAPAETTATPESTTAPSVSFSRPEIGRTRVALGSDSLDVVKTNSGYEVRMPDGRVADTFTKAGEAKAWAQSELEANAWAKEAEVEPLGGAGPQRQAGPSEERSAGRGYFVTEDRYQDSARRFAEAKSRWLSLGIDAGKNQEALYEMAKEVGVQIAYHLQNGVESLKNIKPIIRQYLAAAKVPASEFDAIWRRAVTDTAKVRAHINPAIIAKKGKEGSRALVRAALAYTAPSPAAQSKAWTRMGRLDAGADIREAITMAQKALPKDKAKEVIRIAQMALKSSGSARDTILRRTNKAINIYLDKIEHAAAVSEAKAVIAQARKGKFLDKNKEKIDAILKDIAVSKPRGSSVAKAQSTIFAAASSPDLAQEIPQRLQDKAQGTLDVSEGLSAKTMELLRDMDAEKVQELVQNLKSIMKQDERLTTKNKQRRNLNAKEADKRSAQDVIDRNPKGFAKFKDMTQEDRSIVQHLGNTLNSMGDWTKSTDNIVTDIAGEDSVAYTILVEAFEKADAKFYQLQAQARDHMEKAMEGISEQELKEMGWANSGFEGATRIGQATRIAKPPKLHKIQLPNGKSLVMTSGQRISFALMWNDPDTRYNMLKNKSEGVVLTDDKQNTRHGIDRGSAKAILSSVTPTEQRIADAMSQYLNGPNREALAAWWQDRHGFNPFDNDKYWPRRRLTADKEMEDIVQYEGGLPEHYGIFQMRSGSTAPLMVGDAFSEFFAHINKTATLMAKANALNDAIRLLDRDSEFSKAVKASVKNGEDKLEQLRTRSKNDVVSKVRDRNPGDAEVRKLMSNFGRAKLAANVPVVASQSLSALSMQADIAVKHVAKAYLEARTNRMSKYEQDIRKFAPTLAVMFDGGGARIIFPESSSAAVQDFYGIKSPLEALWTPMKRENEVAVVTAWLAAKREGAEMGLTGDALNEYAGPRATKVYTRSQPSTDMTSQSGVKLSARDNIFWAIAAMFRSQTDKMYQQTIRAITLRKHGEISTAKMVKDISVAVLLQSVIFNATKMLWKGAKTSVAAGLGLGVAGAVSGDDEDKMAALIAKLAVDFVGMIPLFGNIAEPIAKIVTNAARGIKSTWWDTVNQNPLGSTSSDAAQVVQDLVEGKYGEAAVGAADVAGTVAGLPVGEVLRAFK